MPLFSRKCVEVRYNYGMVSKVIPDPILVNSQIGLRALVDEISQQPLVAVDTEANSLYAYRERVCLIQFSIPGRDYLVDPLAIEDLSPLGSLFKHPEIEKIFHAVEYDLIILQNDFNFSFSNLFDTMVAARILGWKSVGLSSILKTKFGITVDKKYQRANWGRRPLPPEMLAYAQLDTHYLIPLRNHLKSELVTRGRWALAQEDFQRSCRVDTNHHEQKSVNCWRINGARDLKPQQVAVLHELCNLRDQKARLLDRPLFKVINDRSLVNIAISCPDSLEMLERVPGVSQKQVRWIGRDLLAAIQRGLKNNPPQEPHQKRPSDEYLNRVESLRVWRKTTAQHMKVGSDVILPKDLLYDLANQNPKNQRDMEQILQTVPWRLEHFGDDIFDLLRNSS
jgi:ribonuclease D